MSNSFVILISLQYFHTVMRHFVAQASTGYTCAICLDDVIMLRRILHTFPLSINPVNITIISHFCSHTICQKCDVVLGNGPVKIHYGIIPR